MPITFPCPGCDSRMRVSRRFAGKRGQCPNCGGKVQIPDLPGSGSDVVAPAAPASPSPAPLAVPPSRDLREFTDSGSGVRPTEEAPEPRQVGRYEIKHELARGGMGVVYVAHDPDLDRPVAIKQLLGSSEKHRKRFQREAKAVARLQHPNIVRVYDVAEDGGQLFMVMDLIEGESLGDRLDRIGTLEPRLAARIAWQTALALHYAHSAGILHRDVKPGNVLLATDGEVKLTDFGLAKSLDLTDDSLTLDATPEGGVRPITDVKMTVGVRSLTADGHVMGTPAYMSPEQAKGQTLDARSDVFSLGSTLYQMLVGEPPFTAPRLTMLLKSVLHDPAAPIRKIRPEVPKELERICLKCLEKRPDDRYPDADALTRDLRAFLDGEKGRSGAKRPPRKRRAASDAAVRSASGSDVRPPLAARLDSLPAWTSWAGLAGFVLLGVLAGVIAGWERTPDVPPVVVKTDVPPIEPTSTPPPADGVFRHGGRTLGEWIADLSASDRLPRVAAAKALLAIGPPRAEAARTALIQALSDEDEAVARSAARALAPLPGIEAAVEPLDRMAHRRLDEPAAGAAVEALAAIGPPAVVALGGLLDRSDLADRAPALAKQVEAALDRLAPRALDATLAALTTGRTSRERRIAAGILARLGRAHGQPAVPALIKALNDSFEAVAIRAARALGAIQDPRAKAPLIQVLTSGSPLLVRAAAQALTALGTHAVEDALTTLAYALGAPRAATRAQARKALGAIPKGTERVRDAITRLGRRDPDRAARAHAALTGSTVRPRVQPPRPRSSLQLHIGSNLLNRYRARRTRPGALPEGEPAIGRALDWLARHQGADGGWSAAGHTARCRGGACRGKGYSLGVVDSFDTALTGLALMAFLGHGHTHRGGPYKLVVRRALTYLADHLPAVLTPTERANLRRHYHGLPRTRIQTHNKTRTRTWVTRPLRGWAQTYELALAGIALREAAAMTGDRGLLPLAAMVRQQIQRAQNPSLGWGYGPRSGINDSSITCWMMQALFAGADPAETARVTPLVEGGLNWLRRATDRRGQVGYDVPGGGSSFLQVNLVRTSGARGFGGRHQLPSLAAHALFLVEAYPRGKLGHRAKGWVRTFRPQAYKLLRASPPRVGPTTTSFHYWYTASHALATQPKRWQRWKGPLLQALVPLQRRAGCARGSWDGVGEWCQVGGRVYATAINALTLQAPYRLKER